MIRASMENLMQPEGSPPAVQDADQTVRAVRCPLSILSGDRALVSHELAEKTPISSFMKHRFYGKIPLAEVPPQTDA